MVHPTSIVCDDKVAEGTLEEENYPSALHTSLMPIIPSQPTSIPSLTGTVETVILSEDTRATEHQDAPLAPEEKSVKVEESVKVKDATEKEVEGTTVSAPSVVATKAAVSDFGNTLALVVEDTVELGEVIIATLENMGLKTDYATHGKQGLAKMRELNPHLLLMDIGLPDITGWKMLDDIKEYYESSALPLPIIIVITAYGDPANRLIGKLQNIYTYLMKPFTPDEVEQVVRRALKGEKPPESDYGASS